MTMTHPRTAKLPGAAPTAGDGTLVVTGGRGGTVARLADLDRCATVLDEAARHLASASWALRGIEARLEAWGTSALDPSPERAAAIGAARVASAEVQSLCHGSEGTRAVERALEAVARDVRSARSEYARADSLAERAVRGIVQGFTSAITLSPAGPLVLAVPLGLALRHEAILMLRGGPVPADRMEIYVGLIANAIRAIPPGPQLPSSDPVPEVSAWGAFLLKRMIPPRKIVALPVIGSARKATTPRGIRDLVEPFRHARTVRKDGSYRGDGVVVTKVDRPDGTTAWSVTIPGTQKAGFGHEDHPFDNGANLALEAGARADSTRAVLAAMAEAGVRPDDPVVLTGHSQGGLVAQQLAASGSFAVAAVLTIGSPTGTRSMRSTVPTLHVEHVSDAVPALDGRPNRDDELTTTVRVRLTDERARSALGSHATATYEESAVTIDANDHPSVDSFLESVEEALGSDGQAVSRTYSVHRLDTAR